MNKFIELKFELDEAQLIVFGLNVCATQNEELGVEDYTRGQRHIQDVMLSALDHCGPSDTGIVVEVDEEGAKKINQAINFTREERLERFSPEKAKALYVSVTQKCADGIADVKYGMKCRYCGARTESRVLLINHGACQKSRCISITMPGILEGMEPENVVHDFKVVKQSLVDWQVLKNGEHFAWITNYKGTRLFTVTFKGLAGEYAGFRNLTAAKKFALS